MNITSVPIVHTLLPSSLFCVKNILVFDIHFFIAPQSCFIHIVWSYFYIFTLLHYALHTFCALSRFCILTSLHCAFHTLRVLSYFCIFTPLHWFCIFILMSTLHSITVCIFTFRHISLTSLWCFTCILYMLCFFEFFFTKLSIYFAL